MPPDIPKRKKSYLGNVILRKHPSEQKGLTFCLVFSVFSIPCPLSLCFLLPLVPTWFIISKNIWAKVINVRDLVRREPYWLRSNCSRPWTHVLAVMYLHGVPLLCVYMQRHVSGINVINICNVLSLVFSMTFNFCISESFHFL